MQDPGHGDIGDDPGVLVGLVAPEEAAHGRRVEAAARHRAGAEGRVAQPAVRPRRVQGAAQARDLAQPADVLAQPERRADRERGHENQEAEHAHPHGLVEEDEEDRDRDRDDRDHGPHADPPQRRAAPPGG